MAFTKALYYPWIDVMDEGWLKNAMLYWEQVQTIVPASIENPYTLSAARELEDEGLLVPFRVHPDMRIIDELTDDVLKYLESPEGIEVLLFNENSEYRFIHPDKLSYELRDIVRIHPEKIPEKIRRSFFNDHEDWISVDSRFANFYMTLLAKNLSEKFGVGLLTDKPHNHKLATAARLDGSLSIPKRRYFDDNFRHNMNIPRSLAQGLLADLIFEKITIDPETSIRQIIKFRREHADELGRFRTKIDELTKNISNDQSIGLLRQQVEDIYVNDVRPSINSLKATLTDSGIKWTADNLLKVTVFSTGSTSIPLLLGWGAPFALLVGAGVSLTASAVSYNRDKADKLRQNPFSYLIASEKEFNTKSDIPLVTPL